MKILTISGSARKDGANQKLLRHLPLCLPDVHFDFFDISLLPLFTDKELPRKYPRAVLEWKQAVDNHDAVVICTPEYIHNIPAGLKNALEWIYDSGELANKRVLPIVYTPKEPRGENAMESLLFSLKALEAQIVVQLRLFQTEISTADQELICDSNTKELLLQALEMLCFPT